MTSYYNTSNDKICGRQPRSLPQFCNFGWNDCDFGLTCLIGPLFFIISIVILFLTIYRIGTACQCSGNTISFDAVSSIIAGSLALKLLPDIIAVANTYRPLVGLLFSIPDFVAKGPRCEVERVSLAAFRSLNVGWASQVSYLYAGFGVLIFTLAYASFFFCATV